MTMTSRPRHDATEPHPNSPIATPAGATDATVATVVTVASVEPAGSLARRDVFPLAISVFQFAVAIGATIAASDVDPVAGLAGSATLSAGSSQLAGIDLIDAGVGVGLATMTAVLINVRFVLYGAGFARWFAAAPRWQRYAMVFPIVDQTFVLCEARFTDETQLTWRRRYYLVVVSALFVSFATGQLAGYFVGDMIPDRAGLELAGPIVFAGLLALAISSRAALLAAIASGGTMYLATAAPNGLGLAIAAAVGLTIGSWSTARAKPEGKS
jgi:predicted branched-subunit amino acid permease